MKTEDDTSAASTEVKTVRARKKLKVEIDGEAIAVETETKEITKRVNKAKGPIALPFDAYPKRVDSEWKVGAHVSAQGGVENAILNAASIGCVLL